MRPRRIHLPVVDTPAPAAVSEIYDDFDDPLCIWCKRPRSRHADPVDLGDGTSMVPACETINGGGRYPGDQRVDRVATQPVIRGLAHRLHLASRMSVADAAWIAGSLGQPSKMPGAAYGLDAFRCRAGSRLAPTRARPATAATPARTSTARGGRRSSRASAARRGSATRTGWRQ